MIFVHVPCQWPSTIPCKMAFVGEAPADYEVIDGRPLVGPSGWRFDKLLKLADIDRAACLVTNVVDVQAPDNDIDKLLVPKSAGAEGFPMVRSGKYLPLDLVPQLDRLRDEIVKCRPNVVVAMGAFAVWAFRGPTAMKDAWGTAFGATYTVPGQKVVASYHPAFTFHQPKIMQLIAMSFAKAKIESLSPEIVYDDRPVLTEPDVAAVASSVDLALKSDLIAVDLETVPRARQIKCVGFSINDRESVVVPFVDYRRPDNSYWPTIDGEIAAWVQIKRLCESPVPKVLQNGLYDARYLYDHGIMLRNYLHDTRLMQHALYPELPKDLGGMAAMYLNERPWKLWRGLREGRKREE